MCFVTVPAPRKMAGSRLSMGPSHRRTQATMATLAVMLATLLAGAAASKLNVPRVLLPYSDTPPSFNLRSEAGCYVWTSTRPDIVNVNVNNDICKSSVVSCVLDLTSLSPLS